MSKFKYEKTRPGQKKREIILLENIFNYSIELAIIVLEEKGWRLLVYSNEEFTTNKLYKSPDDAIKDFKEIYEDHRYMETLEPKWTIIYCVKTSWLNKKLRHVQLPPFLKKIIREIQFIKEYLIVKFGLEQRLIWKK